MIVYYNVCTNWSIGFMQQLIIKTYKRSQLHQVSLKIQFNNNKVHPIKILDSVHTVQKYDKPWRSLRRD